jgi:CHAT domain-containing protein
MSDDPQGTEDSLQQALNAVAHADRSEQIERIVAEHPVLATEEYLTRLDRRIDDIEKTGKGDWWSLTRARLLLGACGDGALDDALFRCRTRDLLPLGPDDVRRRVDGAPELLTEHADEQLNYWASQERSANNEQSATQIELRRGLLRELAAQRSTALVEEAMAQEQEFHRSGSRDALDQALATRLYLLRDPGAPFVSTECRAAHAQAVSRMLQARFRVAGAFQDIEDAITVAEQGLAAFPPVHPLRGVLLTELGNALNIRYRELHAPADISRAIEVFEEVAALPDLPTPDPDDRVTPKVNLSTALLDRYYACKTVADLDRSVQLMREVEKDTPHASGRRLSRIGNLAAALYHVFREKDDRAALRQAIALQREVAETKDSVFRLHALTALARSLDAAAQIGEAAPEDAATLFREVSRTGLKINIDAAMWAGMTWGDNSWSRDSWDAAAEAYGNCAKGARLLFERQGGESGQMIRLSQFRDVAPRAAFALARVGRVDDAAVAFELSRAQLLVQAIERGQTLRRAPALDVGEQTGGSSSTAATRRAFDINDIKAAAGDAPLLYVFYTDRGGAALIVRRDKVVCVELPQLDTKKVENKVSFFRAGQTSPDQNDLYEAVETTTRWLWDAVMGPALEALDGVDAAVVIAGGLLGLLPLHAAWTPDADRPGGRRYALDGTIFSYAPSARALHLSGKSALSAVDALTKGLIVANPSPVSAKALPFAEEEADAVKWHFPQARELLGKQASLGQISQALSTAQFAHLACHGVADLHTPVNSGVIVGGGTLSVRDIRDLHVNARLAVLSACETAVAGTDLPDEIIALPTALLQAGVSGVTGTLWPVPDDTTAMLMAEFYRRMRREKQSPASALRGAQQWLRDTTNADKAHFFETGAGDWLPPKAAQRLGAALDAKAEYAYVHPLYWAAFTHAGL